MSDARPKLEVVEGGAGSGPAPQSSPPPSRPRSRAVIVAWALAGLLALSVLGFAQQGRRADRLEARVAGLQGELAASEAAVKAHRGHLEDVRGAVAQLQELVDRDPVPARASGTSALR